MSERLGRVQIGYVADLIIVDGSPLKSIDQLRVISGVVAQGRWVELRDLHRLWAEVSQSSYERTRQRVLDGLSAQGSSIN
jgi:hypothetical protein